MIRPDALIFILRERTLMSLFELIPFNIEFKSVEILAAVVPVCLPNIM